jgi:endoglucanase
MYFDHRRARSRKLIQGVCAPLVLLLAVGAVLFGGGATAASAQSSESNPLAGLKLFVDRDADSWQQWQAYGRSGQTHKADLIWRIAREPRAVWFGRWTRPNFHLKVRRVIDAAVAEGAVPVFTVMRGQASKCGPHYMAGGPAEDARTRGWYDALARTIGNDRVVIAFEPDSLGTIDCLAPSRRDDRMRLLRYGVDVLARLPNATIYLEAGASDWEPASVTARQLRAIGIAKVRGFMVNASHYDWTHANMEYGLEISRLTGGKHFVINTAENGRGPIHHRLASGHILNEWCNPARRGLGVPPTTDTSSPLVDAYLWISRPGYAQICQGRPVAWYLPRALEYARNATDWLSQPPGTKYGWPR